MWWLQSYIIYLDTDIVMNVSKVLNLPWLNKVCELHSAKFQLSFYRLKQYEWMWYDCLSEYLIFLKKYVSNVICSCVFSKKFGSDFAILVVYVNDT